MKIVEVNEMPIAGEFAVVHISQGVITAKSFKWIGDDLYFDTLQPEPKQSDWVCHRLSVGEFFKDVSKFMVAQPEFQAISFVADWEVMRWIRQNPDRKLYTSEDGDVYAYWLDTKNGYRVTNGTITNILTATEYFDQKVWFIKEGE